MSTPLVFASIAAVLLIIVLVVAVLFRKAIGRSFIVVAEVSILLADIIFVLACGISGGSAANQYAALYGMSRDSAGLIGFVLAALLAFLIAALGSAFFFLLIQIESNTRKVASYFDRMTRTQNTP